jgi:hypothetical protein
MNLLVKLLDFTAFSIQTSSALFPQTFAFGFFRSCLKNQKGVNLRSINRFIAT